MGYKDNDPRYMSTMGPFHDDLKLAQKRIEELEAENTKFQITVSQLIRSEENALNASTKAQERIAELEEAFEMSAANVGDLMRRIAELDAALAAFEDWASPMTEGDYGRGLPEILAQARKALEGE